MQIWRVDLQNQTLEQSQVPPEWEHLGGRGLSARILLDEIDPTCDPLSPGNVLVFAPGLLVGHMLSSCDRISIGGKSPLTQGIKESNAGGTTGLHLARLGIKALILKNHAQSGWRILHLSTQGVRFDHADALVGMGAYQSAQWLIERYGTRNAMALIGPGGERQLRSAGILNLDQEGSPTRISARGGLGAVMGAMRLKAIVIDSQGGKKPDLVDEQAFRKAQKAFVEALTAHPQTAIYRDYGTAGVAAMCNAFGALPTRGFSAGQFENIDSIDGDHLRATLQERGGEAQTTHACMPGCVIRCSNVFADPDGKAVVSPLEYETIGLMGSNLGIESLDIIARLNWLVNDLGLDSIDIGAALGVAARAGLMRFGDGDSALKLMDEVFQGTALGNAIGNGAAATGKYLGIEEIPVVKGQAISAYDPRAVKGTGVTYATSPQGADHTAGLTLRAKVDHLDPHAQVEVSRNAQINMAGYDTLGACIFAGFGFASAPSALRDLLNARYGWEVEENILQQLGSETLRLELEFNRQAGFTPADDRMPQWLCRTPLPPTAAVFDVSDEELDTVFSSL